MYTSVKISKYKKMLLAGVLGYILFFLSFFIHTYSKFANYSQMVMYGTLIISLVCYCFCMHYVCEILGNNENIEGTNLFKVNCTILVSLTVLITIMLVYDGFGMVDDYSRLLIGGYFFSCFYFFIKDISNRRKSNKKAKKVNYLFDKKTYTVIALAVVLIIITYQDNIYYFWDFNLFLNYIDGLDVSSFFNLDSLAFYGHKSYSFDAIVLGIRFLCGNSTVMAFRVTCYILMVVGIVGFSKCIRLLMPDSPVIIHTLTIAVFACSPYVLGLNTMCYSDYALICLTPILIYLLYEKNAILLFWTALIYCLCRETAVISYFFLIIGFFLTDIFKNKKFFVDLDLYIILMIPVASWLFLYKFTPNWMGSYASAEFGIDITFIIKKIKSLIALNFNWMWLLIIIVGLVFILIRQEYDKIRFIIPIAISLIALFVFSLLLITQSHPRYIDAILPEMYLIGIACLSSIIPDKQIHVVTLTVLTLMMFISSFRTIDPFMKKINGVQNVGGVEMASFDTILSDGWVYNRQYQYFGKAIDCAISDIVENENNSIYFPTKERYIWSFCGKDPYCQQLSELVGINAEYWDRKHHTRATYRDNPNNIPVNIYFINNAFEMPNADLDTPKIELGEGEIGYYVYTDYFGLGYVPILKRTTEIAEEQVFEVNGWKVNRIMFIKR